MKPLDIEIFEESWPVAGVFRISRGSRTQAETLVVHLSDGMVTGRGECLPYARYGETLASVRRQIEDIRVDLHTGMMREDLLALLPAGAARNAVDCALWDFECKISSRSIAELTGLTLQPLLTAYTISLDTAAEMARQAEAAARTHHLLKLKCGGNDPHDGERINAVRAAVPEARLIVDANEGWDESNIETYLQICAAQKVSVVEQPLPAGQDHVLSQIPHPVPVCADESFHGLEDLASDDEREQALEQLAGHYDAVNLKLDKTGGLTAALQLVPKLKAHGFQIMAGCMLSTSLSMAPAFVLAQYADYVDLDGPLLLEKDRKHGIFYAGSQMQPPSPLLWG